MPEGPEVWALAYCLKKLGLECESYGKHLFCNGIDYSFGLSGGMRISNNLKLTKVNRGFVYGSANECESLLKTAKCDWMNSTKKEITEIVEKWKMEKPKHKIISLLKDQTEICGLGVAWISEIMHESKLPIVATTKQINELLIDSICNIRDSVKSLYQSKVDSLSCKMDQIRFVNCWCYYNLYRIRPMNVYQHVNAIPIKTCGRIFYQFPE